MAARRHTPAEPRWLLLIHQIPANPVYFRAKVGRRLQRVGAVPIKNSVYALPHNDQTQEDIQWIAREIVAEGGDATLCRASFIEGMRDNQVEQLFKVAREAEYREVVEEARRLAREMPSKTKKNGEHRTTLEGDLGRLRKRVEEITAIDFFGAAGREAATSALRTLEGKLENPAPPSSADAKPNVAHFRGRTWVTRKNVRVDRIASAWLVRRFIDPKAKLKFVEAQGYERRDGEVSFDMFEADFTHIGDRCTFEVLVDRFELGDAGLRTIGEVVHDIDVKDGKFGRGEAAGIADVIGAIAIAKRSDEERVELGSTVLDGLLELYGKKGPTRRASRRRNHG